MHCFLKFISSHFLQNHSFLGLKLFATIRSYNTIRKVAVVQHLQVRDLAGKNGMESMELGQNLTSHV